MFPRSWLVWCALAAFCCGQARGIQCYFCNSHNDTDCADKTKLAAYKVECDTVPEYENQTVTLCRKIVQSVDYKINGMGPDKRVIRRCGWVDNKYKDRCYSRAGYGGRQVVCSCMDDFCNSADSNRLSAAALIATLSVGYVFFRF